MGTRKTRYESSSKRLSDGFPRKKRNLKHSNVLVAPDEAAAPSEYDSELRSSDFSIASCASIPEHPDQGSMGQFYLFKVDAMLLYMCRELLNMYKSGIYDCTRCRCPRCNG